MKHTLSLIWFFTQHSWNSIVEIPIFGCLREVYLIIMNQLPFLLLVYIWSYAWLSYVLIANQEQHILQASFVHEKCLVDVMNFLIFRILYNEASYVYLLRIWLKQAYGKIVYHFPWPSIPIVVEDSILKLKIGLHWMVEHIFSLCIEHSL